MLTHLNLARGFRGGERQTELLIRGLSALGWHQRLVYRAGEPLGSRLDDVPHLDLRPARGGIPGALVALRGSTLVHSHEGRGLQAAWLRHGLAGTPYVVTRRVQKGPRASWLNRRMYPRAAAVAALSAAIRSALLRLLPSLPVVIIPSASSGLTADPAAVARLRQAAGAAGPGAFVVGHVGALDDSHKGQRQILALARRLKESGPAVRFVLVGGGRDEAALRAEAADLPNLHFAGQVSGVGDWLGAFDLFLFPSRHEGLGSILLDALSFGLPIVATRVGGIPEVVDDGVNGVLVAPDDVGALERAVLAFRDNAELRARVQAANRERAAEFSPEAMSRRYDTLYRRLAPVVAAGLPVPPASRPGP